METNNVAAEAVVSPTPHPMPAASPATQTAQEVRPADDTGIAGPVTVVDPHNGGTTITDPVIEGPTPPPSLSDSQVQIWTEQTAAIGSALAPYGEVIPPLVKKHMGKQRIGLEPLVPLVETLARQYGLSWPGYPTDQFDPDVELVNQLTTLSRPVAALQKQLTDSVFAKRAVYYQAAQGLYAMLLRISLTSDALATDLIPLRRFFSTKATGKGKSKGKSAGQAPPANDSGASAETTGTSASASAGSPAVSPVVGATVVAPSFAATVSDRRRHPRLEHRS